MFAEICLRSQLTEHFWTLTEFKKSTACGLRFIRPQNDEKSCTFQLRMTDFDCWWLCFQHGVLFVANCKFMKNYKFSSSKSGFFQSGKRFPLRYWMFSGRTEVESRWLSVPKFDPKSAEISRNTETKFRKVNSMCSFCFHERRLLSK